MGIKAFFDKFADRVTSVYGGLGLALPTIKLGANAISEQDSQPRIVVVPVVGAIGYSVGQAGFGDGVVFPQVLWVRKARLELHLWAKDFDACEAMIDHCCAAIHNIGWGADRALSEDWTKGQAVTAKSGLLVVLGVTVEFPIVHEAEKLARITDFTPVNQEIDALASS